MEVWRFRGVPENPSAWLMATAKHCAVDVLRRERTAHTFAPELGRLLQSEWTLAPGVEELFGSNAIQDALLRMMFSCCHPRLPEEAQVALVLHILCGFSVDEIASAFVSGHAAIEKRITRAKKVLAGSKRLFDITASSDFSARLPAVHDALYLLFNEGYHGASAESAVRAEICHEAMPLTALLLEHPLGATPTTCAHVSERSASAGADRRLGQLKRAFQPGSIVMGSRARERRAATPGAFGRGFRTHRVSRRGGYRIGSRDCSPDGGHGLGKDRSLYDTLMTIRPSPIVALNRAIAVAQHEGPERGLAAIRVIDDRDRLSAYPFYAAALGELELRRGRHETAREYFRAALALARNPMERRFLD
jgi:predicted RNA polymerase sigma factor